jgi:hypothetical protein
MLKRRKNPDTDSVSELKAEYRYASHHHLVPLYALSGLAILTIVVLGCFVIVLWQANQRESFRPAAENTVSMVDSQYLPAVIVPSEKKQYVYSANVRFPISDPYNVLRYAFDPGVAGTPASATITLTTNRTLQSFKAYALQHPERVNDYSARLQECSRLYVIRFVPGLLPYGGFTPLAEFHLKDGRTAYIHKNATCVPDSVQTMNDLDKTEKVILAVESY